MLQFTPDRAAALREARRVLVRGGRLVAATWRAREEQPLFDVLGRIAERHLGVSNEKRFSFGDEGLLRAALASTGFAGVHVEIVERTDTYREFPFRMSALAANFDLSALTDAEREAKLAAIESESLEAVERFLVGGEIAAPTRACIVTATAE
jgi:hypothetical protein